MPELPAHASPALKGSDQHPMKRSPSTDSLDAQHFAPPPALLSPAFTPPATPGTGTPAAERDAPSIPLDASTQLPAPRLLQDLPHVECVVRARIPTTTGQEMFLHLYQNNVDSKEHLAIVFGTHVRSRSLDAVRPGETERDRMIRGAYTGRLFPGRTESGIANTTGTASPMHKSLHKPQATTSATHTNPTSHHQLPSASRNSTEDIANESIGPTSLGSSSTPQAPLVRIHSECYTGETVWSARCDCGEQLDEAARLMSLPSAQESGGVIVYLRQEGRGIGLSEKLKAYNLQDLGNDTVEANLLLRHPADARSYGLATAILIDLGLGNVSLPDEEGQTIVAGTGRTTGSQGIRLLTNNPDKVRAVEGPNREVMVRERVPMVPLSWRSGGATGVYSPEVNGYLKTKVSGAKTAPTRRVLISLLQIEKMGHLLQSG